MSIASRNKDVAAAGRAALVMVAILTICQSSGKSTALSQESGIRPPQGRVRVDPRPLSSDSSIRYDYDIVYVRAPRVVKGADGKDHSAPVWPNASAPTRIGATTDLMILHPDGRQEVLVEGGKGAIGDPYVSFDAQWVYFSWFHDLSGRGGADVYKVHVPTRKVVRLTQQDRTPNAAGNDRNMYTQDGIYNMHPTPLPGGRVAFVSDRDGFKAARAAQSALQLFVMDDDGANVEKIGHLNVGQALHPVILKDGRIIFSSLEIEARHNMGWGILGIHPDGSQWNPVVSGLSYGGAPLPFHFQAQLSDESIIVESYYIPGMGGFGVYFKQPAAPPEGTPPFLSALARDDPKMMMAGGIFRMPFQPYGMEVLTRFTVNVDHPTMREDPANPQSRHAGWVTQPCGAPDNHLLTVWSGMLPVEQSRIEGDQPIDAGIYLIKDGRPFWEPGDMFLVLNDPKYNEQWPRPLVPYRRIYGVDEPERASALRNDGRLSERLPEGTPFGLVGTSSLYKRETFPNGEVRPGSVTATGSPYLAFPTPQYRINWEGQGADAGLYENSDIHAIRILAMEPPSIPIAGRFHNIAGERLRILGEFPVRKFTGDRQPVDPDGNPDTSFLARIPTDMAWTFQTLNKEGMVLNMAQTWHQLRPGELRTDCGGCHAHSQKPTVFAETAAARRDYPLFDLTKRRPLLTSKQNDQSGRKWDENDETGVRYVDDVLNVEYYRDVKPILERSCVACHTSKSAAPAGKLVLDDDTMDRSQIGPGTYRTLASKRYVWPFQSRASLLTWKIFGRRTDGFPENTVAGAEGDHAQHVMRGGSPFSALEGSIMPPPDAVAGTYRDSKGQPIKVAPLSDEDRRTILRWIDLGVPIDFDFDPKDPRKRGRGWMFDDQRPTLTLTYPKAGPNEPIQRIVIGMYDYDTGLDLGSFSVVADFPLAGVGAGKNLAGKFKALPDWRWELTLPEPIANLQRGKLTVSIKDQEGNVSRIERTFSVRSRAPSTLDR